MRTVEQLAEEENSLIKILESVKGTIDEKYDQLEEMGVFDKYKNLHLQYANLSNMNLEALKRAVFLVWIRGADPGFVTGINELDNESVNKTMHSLNDHIKKGIDAEFEWMLNYYSSWGYLFDDYEYLDAVKSTLLVEPTKSKLPEKINTDNMAMRGQMGSYWNSIIV